MMCADGYQPRVIDTEPSILGAAFPWMDWKDGRDGLLQYFTFCPLDLFADSTITRHCSDPITTVDDNTNISLVCNDNDIWKYPREMKNNYAKAVYFFVCCDIGAIEYVM